MSVQGITVEVSRTSFECCDEVVKVDKGSLPGYGIVSCDGKTGQRRKRESFPRFDTRVILFYFSDACLTGNQTEASHCLTWGTLTLLPIWVLRKRDGEEVQYLYIAGIFHAAYDLPQCFMLIHSYTIQSLPNAFGFPREDVFSHWLILMFCSYPWCRVLPWAPELQTHPAE